MPLLYVITSQPSPEAPCHVVGVFTSLDVAVRECRRAESCAMSICELDVAKREVLKLKPKSKASKPNKARSPR